MCAGWQVTTHLANSDFAYCTADGLKTINGLADVAFTPSNAIPAGYKNGYTDSAGATEATSAAQCSEFEVGAVGSAAGTGC